MARRTVEPAVCCLRVWRLTPRVSYASNVHTLETVSLAKQTVVVVQ